jgi:uncharacterized glyoxalase superfamily protein PhnB
MGFEIYLEPEGWVFLRRGGAVIFLGSCPDAIAPAKLGDHAYFAYLEVDDVGAWHREIAARGGAANAPPEDKPWGMREFAMRTPDGHRLMIGQAIRER